MSHIAQHSAAPTRRPLWPAVLIVASALAVIVGLLSVGSLFTGANAAAGIDPLALAQTQRDNCQILAANATSSAQRTRANQCVADQNLIIQRLSPTPSPSTTSPSPSPSASPSPSSSPSSSPSASPSVSPSASPSPSPTSTGGFVPNCINNLAACGLPNATNTGVQPGVALTTVNGNVTLGTFGQVYENKLVTGCIAISAANVTIRNVKVTGNCFYSIDTVGAGYDGNATIEHVEIACPVNGTAIGEKGLTVRFANIHGCENGFDLDGNATVTDSYLHDLLQDGNAHTDGIQTPHGSSNITVRHNTIDARGNTTSAMITDPDGGTTNVTIADNLLWGGAITLYCRNNSTGWSVTDNRFIRGAFGYTDQCQNVPIWTGNVIDSTGGPVPVDG